MAAAVTVVAVVTEGAFMEASLAAGSTGEDFTAGLTDVHFVRLGFGPYYDGCYPYAYNGYYDDSGCYVVRRRVHTRFGWRSLRMNISLERPAASIRRVCAGTVGHTDNEKFSREPNDPEGCKESELRLWTLPNSSTSKLNTVCH